VVSAGVQQLINTNLKEAGGDRELQQRPGERCIRVDSLYTPLNCSVTISLVSGTYLAEMVPVECHSGLRSQLEEMELCSEDLLSL
ncbi:hypothetical protein DVA76_19270, partial [Acinetobacter baumannii]